MSRYALFAGDDYYPCGGIEDLRGTYDTLKEAMAGVRREYVERLDIWSGDDWAHIADMETFAVVKRYTANRNAKIDGEWVRQAPSWVDA